MAYHRTVKGESNAFFHRVLLLDALSRTFPEGVLFCFPAPGVPGAAFLAWSGVAFLSTSIATRFLGFQRVSRRYNL